MMSYNQDQPIEFHVTFKIKLKNKIGVLAKTMNIISSFPAQFA
jgi:hypothetical protein